MDLPERFQKTSKNIQIIQQGFLNKKTWSSQSKLSKKVSDSAQAARAQDISATEVSKGCQFQSRWSLYPHMTSTDLSSRPLKKKKKCLFSAPQDLVYLFIVVFVCSYKPQKPPFGRCWKICLPVSILFQSIRIDTPGSTPPRSLPKMQTEKNDLDTEWPLHMWCSPQGSRGVWEEKAASCLARYGPLRQLGLMIPKRECKFKSFHLQIICKWKHAH